jgi:hypothetical protein
MAGLKFLKNKNFPDNKAFFTEGKYFWKMEVREWAFFELDAINATGLTGNSNNNNIVPTRAVTSSPSEAPQAMRTTNGAGGTATIRGYANQSGGGSFVYMFGTDPGKAEEDVLMQVQVVERRARSEKEATLEANLTRLSGRTIAINAHDAQAYRMTKTVINPPASNPLNLFDQVENKTDHVVVSCHGGILGDPANGPDGKPDYASAMRAFVGGAKPGNDLANSSISVANVKEVFSKLKGKLNDNAVIWLGGCTMAGSPQFCKLAAMSAGCYFIAPGMALLNKKFPQHCIDLVDKYAVPAIYDRLGNTVAHSEFFAKQDSLNFKVPV